MPTVGGLTAVVIDVADLNLTATFSSAVLGVSPGERIRNYRIIGPRIGVPAILLQEELFTKISSSMHPYRNYVVTGR